MSAEPPFTRPLHSENIVIYFPRDTVEYFVSQATILAILPSPFPLVEKLCRNNLGEARLCAPPEGGAFIFAARR